MTELKREIIEDDLPQIRELLNLVFGDFTYKDIVRLGGMTNHSYKITRNNEEEFLVRISGEGTEKMINRRDERKSTELACRLGIDSELLYFGDDGKKVMRFIKNPQSMTEELMKKEENIIQAAQIFKQLHTCGEDTKVRFEVFEMADLYEKIIRDSGVAVYEDYEAVKKNVMEIKEQVDVQKIVPRVPCHNDSLIGNWVLDCNNRLYLIDWEYSGMNEPMWDLSCLSIELGYSDKEDDILLQAYYGRMYTIDEKRRFAAAKLYVDYLWTLWGLTRVPFDGNFMQEYADGRYTRLKSNIKSYQKI